MNDREPWDRVEQSLKREFSPPALDDLNARIAAAAAEAEASSDPAPSAVVHPIAPRRATWVAIVAAVAVAAAVALVWVLGSWGERRDDPGAGVVVVPTTDDTEPTLLASRHVAGEQLDGFLRRGEFLPGVGLSCATHESPPPNCDEPHEKPQLLASADVELVGECDIASGIDCAQFDLPAQRALLVYVAEAEANVIVCIEPPWADPHPVLPPDSPYNIFRRTVGTYVLYEITPLDHPVASTQVELVREK